MRTTRSVKLLVAVATVSLMSIGTRFAYAQDIGDPVTIEKDRILIPGTNISEKDQRALNTILAQYDKSLYKINGYVNGKASKPVGTLAPAQIDPPTAARAAVHAKDPHFTGWTLQVTWTSNQQRVHRTTGPGNTSNQSAGNTASQSKSGNTSNQSKPGNTSNQSAGTTANTSNTSPGDASKARELINRLTPILRKYTKVQKAR